MHELNPEEKEVLELLLENTPENGSGVDSLSFRAQHFGMIDLIDKLETEGYIRQDQVHYFVSLMALVQINNTRSNALLENAEQLFSELKTHYTRTQRDAVNVDALADQLGICHAAAREALSYMVEGTWWGSRSTSFFEASDVYIQPSESILRFKTFTDVVEQLRRWQTSRIKDRQLTLANGLQYTEVQKPFPSVSSIQRQKPDWFMQIPESPRDVLGEIYAALSLDLRALPAMGVRAVIDVVCTKLLGDSGTFENKIKELKEGGHITDAARSILSAAVDAGSASAHRGYFPSREDLATLLDILENLLWTQYVLPHATEQIKANTPPRPAKKNKF